MSRIFICILFISVFSSSLQAQTFIKEASVEYEVKTNLKKTLGDAPWAEMMKDKLPTFKTAYFKLDFSGSKSLYAFDRWEDKSAIPEFMRGGDEQNKWYFDYQEGHFAMQKSVFGSVFDISDSIQPIEWKLTNESRMIAGFNCRKAVAVIMDSVYVFAFYTEEILLPGGPCSLHGLPGLIMGMTIPRLYASWIATKVSVNGVPVQNIKAPVAKKPIPVRELKSSFFARAKEWNPEEDESSKKWVDQFLWNTFL